MDVQEDTHKNLTRVIGCLFSMRDLCFVRIETALISVAFDQSQNVILYTREIKGSEGISQDLKKDKAFLKKVLGDLFKDSIFGVHRLKGGPFEITIPEKSFTTKELNDEWNPYEDYQINAYCISSETVSDEN